jgi:hypothetical protein
MNEITVSKDYSSLTAKVYGLDAMQTLVLRVYCDPGQMLSNPQYRNVLSVENVAQYLGIKPDRVLKCLSGDKFLDALYDHTVMGLKLKKAAVDEALIKNACNPGPYGNQDRKLYYALIGALDKKGEKKEPESAVSRQQKIDTIAKVLGMVNRVNYPKELLDARPKRPRPGHDSGPGSVPKSAETVPKPEADRQDGIGGKPPGVPVVPPDVPLAMDSAGDIQSSQH